MPKENNMWKSYDKTNIARTETDSRSGAIRQRRSDSTTGLIGKPVMKHSLGKKATRLFEADSTGSEGTSLSSRGDRRKRKSLPVCDIISLVNNKDRKLNKTSSNICAKCLRTSARNQSGETEPLQQCAGNCGVLLHPSCLAIKCGPLTALLPRGYRWFCQDCRKCSTIPSCSVTDRKTYLLKCDKCERGYHFQCLQPTVAVDKPKSAWRCLFCRDHGISRKVEPFNGRVDGNKLSLKIKISISNFHNRENRNTMKHENTNKLDNGEKLKLNSCKDRKKQKNGLENWMVPLDIMPNSYDKTNIVKTEANSLSTVKSQHHRPDITSLIKTPILQHSSGRKAQLLKVDSNATGTTPLSLFITGKKRKRVLIESSDKKIKKVPNSYDKTNIVQTEANSLSTVKSQHHRPDITSLIKTPILQHSSGRKAQLLKVDSNATGTTPLSHLITGKKRKRVLIESSDKKNKKVPNSYGKTNIVQTEANSLSTVKSQHHRPDITSLIKTPILQHSSGRKAQLLKVDSNATGTTPLSHLITGKKRKRVLIESSDKKIKKEKLEKPSISSSKLYLRDFMVDSSVTSAPHLKKEKFGKPSISGSMYLRDVEKDCNVPFSLARITAKKRKRPPTAATDQKFKKEKLGTPSIVGLTYQRDVTKNVLKNTNPAVAPKDAVNESIEICDGTKSRTENRTIIKAPIRCPAQIQFGKFEVETSYSCSFPQEEEESAKKLMFCEYCLKYTKCQSILERHMRHCYWRQPPGIEIYRSEDFSVFEVDGNLHKTYCQTLCRIGKLFLELKTLDYGVELFSFYILTKNDGFGCHLVGYFSKIKNNVENFNVACIVTMPQYRRQGYGRILIELSYLLSKIEKQPGTPETPLSHLGQLTYNKYWKGVILEYLDAHRDGDKICIDDIINETGLIGQDIINTLESLNMIVEIFKKITICIDWDIVDAHIKKKTRSKQIHIEQDRLRWTPPTKTPNVLFPQDGKLVVSILKDLANLR